MASDKDQKSKEKLGHRRIGQDGVISYKKVNSNHLMGSIQLGLGHAVGNLSKHDDRDLLMQVGDHLYILCKGVLGLLRPPTPSLRKDVFIT